MKRDDLNKTKYEDIGLDASFKKCKALQFRAPIIGIKDTVKTWQLLQAKGEQIRSATR